MHVRLTEDAQSDLDAIKGYIEPRSPQGFKRIFSAIFSTLAQLESHPFLGHDGRVEGTREVIVPRTPFIIVSTLNEPSHIDIDRILHGRRRYPLADENR